MILIGKSFTFALALLLPFSAWAAIPETYTMENYFTAEHDRPATFSADTFGNFFGFTETGKYFSQINIENNLNVRLQKFSIDEAYFYVSDKGTILADDDLVALSIYLTMA